jgi:hypothetical protein
VSPLEELDRLLPPRFRALDNARKAFIGCAEYEEYFGMYAADTPGAEAQYKKLTASYSDYDQGWYAGFMCIGTRKERGEPLVPEYMAGLADGRAASPLTPV